MVSGRRNFVLKTKLQAEAIIDTLLKRINARRHLPKQLSKIGPYKVDGYYENENGQKYVLEFNGKFWHGCLHCYNASTVNPVNGMTMGDLYQRSKGSMPLCPSADVISKSVV
jgi:hypothetical protein